MLRLACLIAHLLVDVPIKSVQNSTGAMAKMRFTPGFVFSHIKTRCISPAPQLLSHSDLLILIDGVLPQTSSPSISDVSPSGFQLIAHRREQISEGNN